MISSLLQNRARGLLLVAWMGCAGWVSTGVAATSITQHGITWSFDRDHQHGRFANGDHWVVGPVNLVSITPRTTTIDGVSMHGSMVNPKVNGPQGYDSRIKNNAYSASANVANLLPLTLPPGTSLLSSESFVEQTRGDDPQLKTIAILTILDAPAPAGSFRPPPVGTSKDLLWNTRQLDRSRLRSLRKVSGTPPLKSLEAQFERPWIEQGTTWVARYLHPAQNQPSYGREIAHAIGHAMLALQLDYPADRKETLLVRMVQYGIDVYGSARAGAAWPAGGGHNHGRKLPLVFAGVMLNDAGILRYADGARMTFQEDRQTFYVTAEDVGRPLYRGDRRRRDAYTEEHVGLAEWGEKHFQESQWDGSNWNAPYRDVFSASIAGHVLAARLMGMEALWNWPALFDYIDRFCEVEHGKQKRGPNALSPFVSNMWKAYRHQGQPGVETRRPAPKPLVELNKSN